MTPAQSPTDAPGMPRPLSAGNDGACAPGAAALTIELSRTQVDQVVRAAAGGRSISTVLSGMLESPEELARTLADFDDTRLSRSLLSGLLVFAAFPADGRTLAPGSLQDLGVESEPLAHVYPQVTELPEPRDQHLVAGTEAIRQRRLPTARAGGGE